MQFNVFYTAKIKKLLLFHQKMLLVIKQLDSKLGIAFTNMNYWSNRLRNTLKRKKCEICDSPCIVTRILITSFEIESHWLANHTFAFNHLLISCHNDDVRLSYRIDRLYTWIVHSPSCVLTGGKVVSVFAACARGSEFESPVGSVADTT